MFANCQLMGMDLAFPDICKTPPALIPIPYPNFALGPMGIPNAWNILLMGMPAHNLLTTIMMTNGDNPGLALGLISPSVMGPSRHITCVPNVLFKCIPATRLTSLAVQNRFNALGIRAIPSQIKVVLLGAGGAGAASKMSKAASKAKGGGNAAKKAGKGSKARSGHNAKTTKGSGKSPKKKSARLENVGRTPGKSSRTGREVQARMRKKGLIRENPITGKTEFKATDKKWYTLDKADMAHKKDVVKWWNRTGRKYGKKAPEVRKWMLDSKNYRLDHYSINRRAGARLKDRYLPALK